jgi:hypothetical protein
VVEVIVGGYRHHAPPREEIRGVGEEADEAQSGVDEQIGVAAGHMPAIAP